LDTSYLKKVKTTNKVEIKVKVKIKKS